jgi:hypothetical protein
MIDSHDDRTKLINQHSYPRAAELDAEVRLLLSISGINVGECVILKALEAAVRLAPTDTIRLKPGALFEALAKIRAASPKPDAIAVDVVSIAQRLLDRELLCEVSQGS